MVSAAPAGIRPIGLTRRAANSLRVIPYFVFGGFVLPLAVEAVRTAFSRTVRFHLPHFLTLLILPYLVLNLWLVGPLSDPSTTLTLGDFFRWQLREIVPLLAVLVTASSRPTWQVDRYARTLLSVGAVLGLVGLLEYLYASIAGATPLGTVRQDPSGGLLFVAWLRAHNAAGGVYAALSAIGLSWFIQRRLGLLVLTGNIVALALTASRSAYGSFVAVTLVLLILRVRRGHLRKVLVGLVIAAVLASQWGPLYERLQRTLAPTEFSRISRVQDYERAYDYFSSSPVIGVGWAGFSQNTRVIGSHAHNSYLHVLAELGLVGFALLGWWVGAVSYMLWKRKRLDLLAALGTLAVSALLDHNFGSPTITAPLFVLIGMALSSRAEREPWRTQAPLAGAEVPASAARPSPALT